MIDANDHQTQDAFPAKRGRGRPRTSSPEKRKADTAERQRRFRARQRVKAFATEQLVNARSTSDRAQWTDFVSYLMGGETQQEWVTVSYKRAGTNLRDEVTMPELEALLLDPETTELYLD